MSTDDAPPIGHYPEGVDPRDALRDLATRWESTPPAHHAKDGFTAAQAPTMLRRLATKLASPDPAVAALGAEQLRGVGAGWHDKASPAALTWGEAVALLPGDAPTVAPAESPAHPLALVMAQAYERGRAKGREEERARGDAWRTWGWAKLAKSCGRGSHEECERAWAALIRIDPEGTKAP